MIKRTIRRGFRVSRYVVYKETLVNAKEHFWSFLGSFISLAIIGFIQSSSFSSTDTVFIIGSFGASCVLIYGAIQSPLSQPRNFIGGHLISAIIGVSIYKYLPHIIWLNAPLAVASSIVLMQITKTLHPPGGATALIAIIGSEKVRSLGYLYVLTPVLSGVIILLLVALVFNNVTPHRHYPNYSQRLQKLFVRKKGEDV